MLCSVPRSNLHGQTICKATCDFTRLINFKSLIKHCQSFVTAEDDLLCAELNVCEVLVPKGQHILLPESKSMLKGLLPEARFSLQPAKTWESGALLADLRQGALFAGQDAPQVLSEAASSPEQNEAMLSAFAGMRAFLKRSMLEDAVLKVGSVERLPGQLACGSGASAREASGTVAADAMDADAAPKQGSEDAPQGSTMVLDASALSNLEVCLLPLVAICVILS